MIRLDARHVQFEQGDTFYSVARALDVPPGAFAAANEEWREVCAGVSQWALIKAGYVFHIPAVAPVIPDPEPEPEPEPDPTVPGMTLVLSDDFDTFDTSLWYRYENTYGDGNNELQRYRGGNVTVADSVLSITAKRENFDGRNFTSGFVSTKSAYTSASPRPVGPTYFPRFGRYEMRAKIPHAQGLWPAFWLRHRDGASVCEVDVMEYFHSQIPGRITQTLHLDGQANAWKRSTVLEDPRQPAEWHTYAVDILPEGNDVRFRMYLDGVEIGNHLDTGAQWATRYPGQPLFDVSLNLAIGGNWTGHPDDDPLGRLHLIERCSIGGSYPNSCLVVSSAGVPIQRWAQGAQPTFDVDWVRIYEFDQ